METKADLTPEVVMLLLPLSSALGDRGVGLAGWLIVHYAEPGSWYRMGPTIAKN